MASLNIRYKGVIIGNTLTKACSCYGCTFDADIVVDGADFKTHFTIENDNRWIKVERLMNKLTFFVDGNVSKSERVGVVYIKHNLDAKVSDSITIRQEGMKYSISVPDYSETVTFTNFPDNDGYEEVYVDVSTEGGNKDFGIMPVRKYVRRDIDDSYQSEPYDGALSIRKLDSNRLCIRSYGRVSLVDDTVYDVVLYHRNNTKENVTITIKYHDVDTSEGFSFE